MSDDEMLKYHIASTFFFLSLPKQIGENVLEMCEEKLFISSIDRKMYKYFSYVFETPFSARLQIFSSEMRKERKKEL